jgi:hypothetical protein
MDFITDLPPSSWRGEVYDLILVAVDWFTKMAIYIPTTKKLDTEGLADIFLEKIIACLGTPSLIISDCGSLFTSDFWSQLLHQLGIKCRMSTAFYPQTDGQTERQNQVLEHYLRIFVNYQQDDWVSLLWIAEFAYNNSTHASTRLTPFYLLMGYNPRSPFEVGDGILLPTNAAVDGRMEAMRAARDEAAHNLRLAVEIQEKYYNMKY